MLQSTCSTKEAHTLQLEKACMPQRRSSTEKKFFKFFFVEYKGSRIAKTIQKRTTVGGFMLPDFETESHSVVSNSLQPHGQSMEFSRPEYWSGKPFLSPGDLPNPGIEPSLPHCRQSLQQLSHKGIPRILEWVAYPFSSGLSRPRNRTGLSYIAGGFFTN